jgi:hypothetical protein
LRLRGAFSRENLTFGLKLVLALTPLVIVGMETGLIPTHASICEPYRYKDGCDPKTYDIASIFIIHLFRFTNDSSGIISAVATVLVAVFTYTLWQSSRFQSHLVIGGRRTAHRQFLISARQTDIQEKQKEISRLQFLTTHRPKIKIRQLNKGNASVVDGLPFTYMAVNIGDANATLVETNQTIVFSSGAHGTLVNESKTKEPLNGMLAPGEFVVVKFREPEIINAPYAAKINSGETPICVFGYIAYADDLGKIRRTGFYRQYQGGLQRFVAIDDPEYEYAD